MHLQLYLLLLYPSSFFFRLYPAFLWEWHGESRKGFQLLCGWGVTNKVRRSAPVCSPTILVFTYFMTAGPYFMTAGPLLPFLIPIPTNSISLPCPLKLPGYPLLQPPCSIILLKYPFNITYTLMIRYQFLYLIYFFQYHLTYYALIYCYAFIILRVYMLYL